MEFAYDAMGNRVSKTEEMRDGSQLTGEKKITYYVRDASGNVMATYWETINSGTDQQTLDELNIYGSSRIGMLKVNKNLLNLPELIFTEPMTTTQTCGNTYFENLFDGGRDSPTNTNFYNRLVNFYAELLINNPTSSLTITGNTGNSKESLPTGSKTNYNHPTTVNGRSTWLDKNSKTYFANTGGLMDLRNDRVKNDILNAVSASGHAIDPNRIQTKRGTHENNDNHRTTEIRINN